MTGIANAVARQFVYKKYSTATIAPGTEADYTSDPGSSGGQLLRVMPGVKMNLQKNIIRSTERRVDRQRVDVRHGGRRAPIEIPGELSCLTYQDLQAAILRGAWASGVSKTVSDFTSVAASSSSSNLTLGSSDFVTLGFKVGDVVRMTGSGIAAANRSVNFQLLGFTNSNTKATVFPAPTTMSAVTANATVAVTGRKVFAPETSPTLSKFLIEAYSTDVGESLLFTEARLGGMKFAVPNEGMATVTFSGLARNRKLLTGASAPFFASPTAETDTSILSSIGGQLLLSGTPMAVITAFDLDISIGTSGQSPVFADLMTEIFTGELDVTGSLTAQFSDGTFLNGFDNETEFELALMLTTDTLGVGDFMSFFMARVKLLGEDMNDSGNEGIPITVPFQAVKKPSGSVGYNSTTVVIQDSLSA